MCYDKIYTEYQIKKRGFLRKIARAFYLSAANKLLNGPTIDIGCGPGELLKWLPAGSIGLEINPTTVEYCKKNNLNVKLYKPDEDNYTLAEFQVGQYQSMLISHVLEHLEKPYEVIQSLLKAANRLGLEKIVIILPCKRGFDSDQTHITFIDKNFFYQNNLITKNKFIISRMKYFPVNLKWIGYLYPYHELHVVYEKRN